MSLSMGCSGRRGLGVLTRTGDFVLDRERSPFLLSSRQASAEPIASFNPAGPAPSETVESSLFGGIRGAGVVDVAELELFASNLVLSIHFAAILSISFSDICFPSLVNLMVAMTCSRVCGAGIIAGMLTGKGVA